MNPIFPRVIMMRDKASFFRRLESEDQCDCACSEVSGQRPPMPSFGSVLIRPPSLQVTKLDEMNFAMFFPSGNNIAVLNVAAIELLDTFRVPRRLDTWLQTLDNTWPVNTRQIIDNLIQLQFLTTPDSQSVIPPFDAGKKLVVWLHITNECNLRCHYCYITKTPDKMNSEIGHAAIDAVFRSAVLHDFTGVKLKYAGGEATLNFPMIATLHQYAKTLADKHYLTIDGVVLSNGVGITHDMIDTMLALGIRLMISLDGLGSVHDKHRAFSNGADSFSAVSRSIERARTKGLLPEISITVSNRNISSLPETINWVLEEGLPFSINFFRENDASVSFPDLRLDEHCLIQAMLATFKVIETKLPKRSLLASLVDLSNLAMPHSRTCSVGTNYMVINHQGGIAKCQMHIQQTVTNVSTIDPLNFIRTDDMGIQNLPVDSKEECCDCEWRYWCTGGCPLVTFRATGRYNTTSPNCNIYKTLFPEVVRLEGLRLLKYHTDS